MDKTCPSGWYVIPYDEEAIEGDYYYCGCGMYRQDIRGWEKCLGYVGHTQEYIGSDVIRRIPVKPEEKEWLNPWD